MDGDIHHLGSTVGRFNGAAHGAANGDDHNFTGAGFLLGFKGLEKLFGGWLRGGGDFGILDQALIKSICGQFHAIQHLLAAPDYRQGDDTDLILLPKFGGDITRAICN